MAEEPQYAAEPGSNNKRKYESDQTTPSPGPRRPTGFSNLSPPEGTAPPSSYNNVPPPMDDFQLAKQKAQEIAARLLNSAEAKKPRVDNNGSGVGAGSGFDSYEHKPIATPPVTSSYGYSGQSKKIKIPNGRVGVVIGKGGETLKYLQLQSGAKIHVSRDMDADFELMGTPDQIAKAEQLITEVLSGLHSWRLPGQRKKIEIPVGRIGVIIGKGGETLKYLQLQSGAKIHASIVVGADRNLPTRAFELVGTPDQIAKAEQLITELLSEADAGGSGLDSRRLPGQQSGAEQFYGYPEQSKKMEIPIGRIGVIIGKRGETLKYLQLQSGAKIHFSLVVDADRTLPNRAFELIGTPDQIAKAEQLITEILSEADAGGSGLDSRRLPGQQSGAEQFYGYPGQSKKIEIPINRIGVIIGKRGETLKYLQLQSGAKIHFSLVVGADRTLPNRAFELIGTPDQIAKAEQLITELLSEADAGGWSGFFPESTWTAIGSRTVFDDSTKQQDETIKYMQARSGARIQKFYNAVIGELPANVAK